MNANLRYYLYRKQGLEPGEARELAGLTDIEDQVAADPPGATLSNRETPWSATLSHEEPRRQPLMPPTEEAVTEENYQERLRDPNRRILSSQQLERAKAAGASEGTISTGGAYQSERPDVRTDLYQWLQQRQGGADSDADTSRKVELAIIRSRSHPSQADLAVAQALARDLGTGDQLERSNRKELNDWLAKKRGLDLDEEKLGLEREKMNAGTEQKRIEAQIKADRQSFEDTRHATERGEDAKRRADERAADDVEQAARFEETKRHNQQTEGAAWAAAKRADASRADKDTEDIPPGHELVPGANPGADSRKKYSGLVAAQEKMKGLTAEMRKELIGVDWKQKVIPGTKKTRLQQLATQIQIEAKNVADLGALSGPDMSLMEAMAADPTSAKAVVSGTAGSTLDGLDSWADKSVTAGSKAYGIRPKAGAAGGADTVTVVHKQSGKTRPRPRAKAMELLAAPGGDAYEVR